MWAASRPPTQTKPTPVHVDLPSHPVLNRDVGGNTGGDHQDNRLNHHADMADISSAWRTIADPAPLEGRHVLPIGAGDMAGIW